MIFLYGFLILDAGIILGFLFRGFLNRLKVYDGIIRVINDEEKDKTIYSLEFDTDPEMLEYYDEVVFKVVPSSEKSANRE